MTISDYYYSITSHSILNLTTHRYSYWVWKTPTHSR